MGDGKVITVESNELFQFVIEVLKSGQTARLNVVGTSMNPFISTNRDSVELKSTGFADIRKGDIVLFQRENGKFVLHRVYKKTADCFYMLGDAQTWIEGPLYPNQVFAKATAIHKEKATLLNKKGSVLACDSLKWRTISSVWMILRPFRKVIMKCYLALTRRKK